MGLRVWYLGFEVWILGFGVWSLGLGVCDLRSRDLGLGLGFEVQVFGDWGSGVWVWIL